MRFIYSMVRISEIIKDIRKMAVTFCLAAVTGVLFLELEFPAPFLIGSLLGVWFIG